MSDNISYEELKQSVEQLKKDFARQGKELDELKRLVDRSQDVIYRYDIDSSDFVLYNKAGYELYGAKNDKTLTEKTVLLSIHPDDRDRVKKAAKESLAPNRAVGEVEYRQQRADGSIRWMHDRWQVIRDESGRPVFFEGIVRDETERKQAEKTLRESKETFRSVIQFSPIGIGMVDATGKLFDCNEALAKMLGYGVDELRGMRFEKLTYPEDAKRERPLIDKVWTGETDYYRIVKRYITKGGMTIWVNLVGSILKKETEAESFRLFFVQDITERKMLEDEVFKHQQRLKQTLDATTDGIWTWNFKKNELFFSPRYYTMLDYEPYEFSANFENWKKLIHPDDFESAIQVAEEYFKSVPDIYENEFRLKTKPGGYVWIHAKAKVVERDENGKPALMIGNHENISKRKAIEETLCEKEQYYRTLLHSLHEDILVIDSDHRVTDVNNMLVLTIGARRENIIGRHCYKILHGHNEPCDKNGEDCRLDEVFKTGKPASCRHIHRAADGSNQWVDIIFSPLKDEKGNVTHVIEAIRDVTPLVKMQEGLKVSEEKYRLLVENANDAILIAQGGLIKFTNPSAEKMSGYSANELARMLFVDLIHPEDRDWVFDRYKRRLAGIDPPAIYSFRILNKAGKELWVQGNAVLINWGGLPATFNFLRDITREKVLESYLQQAQKMEAIGTLAGGIAHDFNNILQAMTGYAEIAFHHEIPEESPARQSIEEVLKAGQRAKDLVKQILTFSRQSEEEKRPVKISIIIKEALKLLRASLPTTLEIRQNLQSDHEKVMTDPVNIHQVIMNLCTNAAHAMGETGGVLEVRSSRVDFDSEEIIRYPDLTPGSYLMIQVSDTGHGMEPFIKERIFEPYFTTKDAGEGTGLGLAVVHGIIKSHGGAISVESEVDKGTIFTIFFPVIESLEEIDAEKTPPIPTGNERILFVDDEKPITQSGIKMLESLGYRVVARTSSIEALALFRSKPHEFDLVITDMTMPNMTGDMLAGEMLGIRRDIPIILCTGFSERITEEKAKAIGIRGFILKPIIMRDLAQIIRKNLDE
jgi:PAS domain S-box-containing protein